MCEHSITQIWKKECFNCANLEFDDNGFCKKCRTFRRFKLNPKKKPLSLPAFVYNDKDLLYWKEECKKNNFDLVFVSHSLNYITDIEYDVYSCVPKMERD